MIRRLTLTVLASGLVSVLIAAASLKAGSSASLVDLGLRFRRCNDTAIAGAPITCALDDPARTRPPESASTDANGEVILSLRARDLDVFVVTLQLPAQQESRRWRFQYLSGRARYDEWVLVDIDPGPQPRTDPCRSQREDGAPIHFTLRTRSK